MKQSDSEVPVLLELWGMWSICSLPSLPCSQVAVDMVLSMGQRELKSNRLDMIDRTENADIREFSLCMLQCL